MAKSARFFQWKRLPGCYRRTYVTSASDCRADGIDAWDHRFRATKAACGPAGEMNEPIKAEVFAWERRDPAVESKMGQSAGTWHQPGAGAARFENADQLKNADQDAGQSASGQAVSKFLSDSRFSPCRLRRLRYPVRRALRGCRRGRKVLHRYRDSEAWRRLPPDIA